MAHGNATMVGGLNYPVQKDFSRRLSRTAINPKIAIMKPNTAIRSIVALTCLLALVCLLTLPTGFHLSARAAEPGIDASHIRVPDGFKVERLYSVPAQQQGSWVALTMDDRQRFIVSDQYGGLYRFPVPPSGKAVDPASVQRIDLDIGAAQGLLYAFDSLYCVLNSKEHGGRGLYRLTDTDGDDQFDKKELLRKFAEQGGEHGPHAVLLGPDGKSLYVVVGNQTPVTDLDRSRVPRVWDEDLLLERPYGRGFMRGVTAPGGWIAKTDPDGKEWELIASGFRNEYDAAFNQHGDLFTFDADMEWDMNTPWYRPTRINHVVSGAEFGWRNGGGKWPDYYTDSVGSVVDIGPGSPTGVAFGYGSKFPQKYHDALYVCDWSYGKLYAVHLEPGGGSYKGTFELFASAQPLPLTDLVVNPDDGALYFTVGGRRVESGFYRIIYVGDEQPGKQSASDLPAEANLRRSLESRHQKQSGAADFAWQYLSHSDRSVRYAARVAIEHQDTAEWKSKLESADDPDTVIQASIALSRVGDDADAPLAAERLFSLNRNSLSPRQHMDWLRAWGVLLSRHGDDIDATAKSKLAGMIDEQFPVRDSKIDAEMLQLLVFLGAPSATAKGIRLLSEAPSQEEQMAYAKSLRHQKSGWTRELRAQLFEWFAQAASYRGGASFGKFIEDMKATALSNTPQPEQVALKSVIEKKVSAKAFFAPEQRKFVKDWSMEDFVATLNDDVMKGRDFANGRKMFGQAACYSCHRFNQEGGAIGPDLTSVAGKFTPKDLLEQVILPSKTISDQYEQMTFLTVDGKVINGRIMNLAGSDYRINTDMMNPNAITSVKVDDVEAMRPSKISMMPEDLLNTLSKDDALDLLAYMLARGNRQDPRFEP